MQNRREFILRSSLAVAAGALGSTPLFGQQAPAAAPQPPTVPVFTPIRRNVGTFTARGGTMGWLVTPDAVLVIDSQFADTAQMFLDGLKTRTPRKIDLLLNTHHHPDHTGGNKVLRPMVTKIVSHENVPGLQKKQAAAAKTEDAQAYADETFKDGWKVDIGKEKVSAKYYGPGHTSGDAVFLFQQANIVHMGDLMSHQRHPRVGEIADRQLAEQHLIGARQVHVVVVVETCEGEEPPSRGQQRNGNRGADHEHSITGHGSRRV